MRTAVLVLALLAAGCATPDANDTEPSPTRVATAILVDADVLLSPGMSRATFPYEIPALGAVSGTIQISLAGSFSVPEVEAPASCPTGDASGLAGSATMTIDCGAIPAGAGELAVRIGSGTAQGRIAFAVSIEIT